MCSSLETLPDLLVTMLVGLIDEPLEAQQRQDYTSNAMTELPRAPSSLTWQGSICRQPVLGEVTNNDLSEPSHMRATC